MSNKAVTDRLVVGRRTVAGKDILVKRDFTSRTQVASSLRSVYV